MVSYDYARMADLYDAFCVYDQDIPFFTALARQAEGPVLELMAGTGRLLRAEGRFVCTMHNPRVRLRSIDGRWQTVGTFPGPEGSGSLTVRIQATYDPGEGVVTGTQRVEKRDPTGDLREERSVALRFSLLERDRFECLAKDVGLEVISLWGDYQGSSFDEEESPCMVWTLRARGRPNTSLTSPA